MRAGGSSSSDAKVAPLVRYINDSVEANCRGSSLSSMVCPATAEVAICFDLLIMYSVTADLGKKIYKESHQSDEH